MTNASYDQRLGFDTELTIAASGFTGTAQFLGQLTNLPVILLIKNQTSVSVFFADNDGASKGTTMAVGEEIVLDCRSNAAKADNMGFPIGTNFFVTASAGTGNFKVSVLYAR